MSDYTLPSDSESEGKSPGFLHWWESPATPSDPGSTPNYPTSTPSEDEEEGGGNGSEGQEEDGGGAASDADDEEEGQEEEEDSVSRFARLEAQEAADDRAAARKKSRALAWAAFRRPFTDDDDEDAISSSFKSSTDASSSNSDDEVTSKRRSCSVELWEIIVHGYREPQDPIRLTSTEFYNRQLNASARDKIRSGINRKLLDQVNDIDSAKELWDRIVVLQEGTDLIQSALYETAKQEAHQFMIRDGESVSDAYARLGALRVRVKGLGVEKYNDGFEMNEAFIKSKVIAMIAVKQQDTNLALNLQIMTKSADLNSDDLVSYVAANENMAKAGKRLMAMNRVDEASHNHEAPHNLALKARADHGSNEDYEFEEEEEMTSTSDIATDFAFFAKKYKAKFPMLLLRSETHRRAATGNTVESGISQDCGWPWSLRATARKASARTSDADARACHLTYTWSGRCWMMPRLVSCMAYT
ncbi:hypothetical protein QYE76_034292 [Lolium multiflorum]|uniref:Uncharacterized protein n=1 Tax=Lolium multiflorum TaxID=4521 RepID=A0AAD8R0A5_LOLMU|nr:hypothetical protein QYE76_034292 [Lolium multiflorum]